MNLGIPCKTDSNDSEGTSSTTQREWPVECTWRDCRPSTRKSFFEYDQVLKGGGGFWDDVNGGYLPEDLVLSVRREEIEWVHSEGVYEIVPMQDCKDAGKKLLELIWVDTDKSGDSLSVKFDRDCVPRNTRRRSKARFKEPYLLLSCSRQCHHLKLLRRWSQSWCLWVGGPKGNHWSWDTTTSAEHICKEHHRDSFTSDVPQKIVRNYGKNTVGRLVKSMYGTQDASHIWQLDHVNLICGEFGGFRRGKHSAALFHNPNKDVGMPVHGDVFMCLSDDDGLKYIYKLLKSKHTAKDMGTQYSDV